MLDLLAVIVIGFAVGYFIVAPAVGLLLDRWESS